MNQISKFVNEIQYKNLLAAVKYDTGKTRRKSRIEVKLILNFIFDTRPATSMAVTSPLQRSQSINIAYSIRAGKE